MSPQKQKRVLIGAIAGAALGAFQMRAQKYDFSDSAGVSQAIGFMVGFVGFGALIGWISGPKEEQ
ncbi:MAG TPA: hypothetical protein VMM56_05260 [Planctomycetaceae bacterium]|nr:hypothetical protein [Planctomycetaceae bacterium]